MYTSTQRGTSGISSGSIDALRVQLMKMNAQQLQAFAQANQDDAIKLGLAAEADKYKKQHAQEAMALMSGQQQKPPIAQQILQSIGQPPQQQQPQGPMPPQGQGGPMPPQGMPPQQMAQGPMPPQGMADGGYVLPEDQGIATLPVGGMDFAEGGIVGYADRGYVDSEELTPEDYQFLRPEGKANLQSVLDFITPKAALENRKKYEQKKAAEEAAKAGAAPVATPVPYDPSTATRRSMFPEQVAPPSAPPAPSAATKGPLANLVKPPAAPAPATAGIAGLSNTPEAVAAEMEGIQKRQKTENPFAKQIEDLTAAERDALTKEKTQFEADIEKAGPAFKERESRLKTREEKLGKQEEKLPYMALMEAGLAIMAGTSPHALTNIGVGGAVGLKSYSSGLDKLAESREKLDDAFGRIEEYRRTENTMNAKERRGMERAINNTYTEAKKLGLAALQEDWKQDRQDANKQFDVLARNRQSMFEQSQAMSRAEMEQRGANARTAMQVNAPSAQERIYSKLGDGNLEAGLRKYGEIMGPEGKGDAALVATYAKNPMALKLLEQTDPQLAAQIKQKIQMMMLQPQSTPTGAVRP